MSHFKNEKNLKKAMDIKWNALRVSCPEFTIKWLNGMHKILDWYERELKNIKQHE